MSKFKKGQLVTLIVDGDHELTDRYNTHNYPVKIHKGQRFYVHKVEYDQVLIIVPDAIQQFGYEGARWWVYEDAVARIKKKVV